MGAQIAEIGHSYKTQQAAVGFLRHLRRAWAPYRWAWLARPAGILCGVSSRFRTSKHLGPALDVVGSSPGAAAPVRAQGPNDPPPADNGRPVIAAWHQFRAGDEPPARHQRYRKVAGRTLSKAWGDSLFGLSSQAAFWCALSTAPMLLALLGLAGLVAPLFGPDTLAMLHSQIDRFLHGVFNPEVANNLVGNTVNTILNAGRGDVISVGLVVSLWAGSSAISAFIEAITIAYRQHEFRPAALERLFALGVYLIALVFGIVLLPLLAIGPQYLIRLLPARWQGTGTTIVSISYYPVTAVLLILLLATLYKVAPKRKHPWRRGLPGALLAAAVFLIASFGLRLYLSYVYTHGLTYGALATPITFLLFYYFASMAIILGAQFNNALLEYYPLHPTRPENTPTPAGEESAAPTAAQPPAGPSGPRTTRGEDASD